MQNKLMAAAPLHTPGALLLGDSFNMRHPLTGGGMTVALGDAALLLTMLQALPSFEDPAATALATRGFYTARKPLSATINTLANALYAVFVAPKPKGAPEGETRRGARRDARRVLRLPVSGRVVCPRARSLSFLASGPAPRCW